jgi:hypothetical protein
MSHSRGHICWNITDFIEPKGNFSCIETNYYTIDTINNQQVRTFYAKDVNNYDTGGDVYKSYYFSEKDTFLSIYTKNVDYYANDTIRTIELIDNKNNFKIIKYYNTSGKLAEERYYSDGRLNSKTISKYNKEGMLYKKKFINYRSKYFTTAYLTYDKNNNISGLKMYDEFERIFYSDVFQYDSLTNFIEQGHSLQVNQYSSSLKYIFKTDSLGNIIEKIRYLKENINGKPTYNPLFVYTWEYKYR